MNPSKSSIKMAMHQPNYIPWLGYFYKIYACDIFIYLDTVQYPRGQSYAARNRIKTPNGVSFLTIPVRITKGTGGKVKYSEVEFAEQNWRDKQIKTLNMNYKRTPFYSEIIPLVQASIETATSLIELNIGLIEGIANYLKIDTKRLRLSEILTSYGQKTDLIVDICKAVGADIYLSGTGGGRDYNDEKLLARNGITLAYSDFIHPVYSQLWGEFTPGLSILDLLFNHGHASRKILIQRD